jgi:GNAT superfamily N-acetyltransferase
MEIRGADWDDLERAVQLLGAQNRAAVGVAGVRLEHLRTEWERPDFRLAEDNFVAVDGGEVVGYAALSPAAELALAADNPAVADALFERIRARAAERGDRTIAVTVLSEDGPLTELVRRHAFTLDHDTLTMWRSLATPFEPPVPPEGITIRTFEQADAHAVHELLDDAYLAWDAGYVPISHDGWVSAMTGDSEFDAGVWFLAERGGELTGCALHWNSGWLKDVAVRESERGRGLGAALIRAGFAEFSLRGIGRVGLKVDAANPTGAVRLYEKLGFVTTNRQAAWLSSL